jgi:hypothetical protein
MQSWIQVSDHHDRGGYVIGMLAGVEANSARRIKVDMRLCMAVRVQMRMSVRTQRRCRMPL